jgi:hypothetical protein
MKANLAIALFVLTTTGASPQSASYCGGKAKLVSAQHKRLDGKNEGLNAQ